MDSTNDKIASNFQNSDRILNGDSLSDQQSPNESESCSSYLNQQPLSCTSQVSALSLNPGPSANSCQASSTNSNAPSSVFNKNGAKSPHCKVCSDESSGFHYGVDSCEGCKGFFRRCITQGMTHKCSNDEKCEITPFTRNSCQYCRLKKCFAVGMSREASRLGRRPKRMKDPGSRDSKPSGNLPIAPYPSADFNKLRMAELQGLLQQSGTLKPEMMEAFLNAAQVSFREHQRSNNQNNNTTTNTNASNTNTVNTSVGHTNNSNTNAGNTISANGNGVVKGQRQGNDSGYSSLSSPSSNKSLSPPQDGAPQTATESDNNVEENKTSVNMDPTFLAMGMNIPHSSKYNTIDIKPEPSEELTSCSKSSRTPTCNVMMDFCSQDLDVFNQNSLPNIQESNFESDFENFSSPDTLGDDNQFMYTEQRDDGSNIPSAIEEMFEDNTFAIDIDKILEEVVKKPSELRRNLIDQVTEEVVSAHFKTCKPTYQNVREANLRLEKLKAQNLVPDFSKVKMDPSKMWEHFLANMVPEITVVVKFCKKIPGFNEICQDDQINLIKQGSFEVLIVRMCNLVDIEKEEMFDPDMKVKCPKDVVIGMPMGRFLVEFFTVAKAFNPLQLTDGEIGLFTAALIICPDRKNIVNKLAIMKLQLLLLQALYVLIKKNHSDYENLFVSVLKRIPVFREINAKHAMELNNMKMSAPEAVLKFPELHKEVFQENL